MGFLPLLVIFNTIWFIFGSEHKQRSYQLGVIIPALIHILIMIILKNNKYISNDAYMASAVIYSILTIGVQNTVLNFYDGLSLKKEIRRQIIKFIVLSSLVILYILIKNF